MKNKKFQSSNFLKKKKKNQSLILQITRYECLFKNRYEDRVSKQKKKKKEKFAYEKATCGTGIRFQE